MSRTVFANGFRDTVGCTPGAYLQRWRIGLAQRAHGLGRPAAAHVIDAPGARLVLEHQLDRRLLGPGRSELGEPVEEFFSTPLGPVDRFAGGACPEPACASRGSAAVQLDWRAVPLMAGVRELAGQGFVTGASGRNWASYGSDVVIPAGFAAEDQALLADPQTSGGLLVSCSPASLDAVMKVFVQHGFGDAAVIGQIVPASGPPRLVVR